MKNLKVGDIFIFVPKYITGNYSVYAAYGDRCKVVEVLDVSSTSWTGVVFKIESKDIQQDLINWDDARPFTKLDKVLK